MDRAAYELANRIKTEPEMDEVIRFGNPGSIETEQYKKYIIQKIQREKRQGKRSRKGKHVPVYAAACAALFLLVGTVFFGDEIHAMVRQISWHVGSAIGISEDLADYSEVVNASVSDKGYVITLQEALANEGELVINYTVQREDGKPMENPVSDAGMIILEETLYINGEKINCASEVGSDFLDEEQKVLGIITKYFLFHVPDIDLSKENEFRVEVDRIGVDGGVKGDWNFAFKADSSALTGDTKRMKIGKSFILPDGVTVTLDEFSTNKLEQRISYSLSDRTLFNFRVDVEDSEGNRTVFATRTQGDSGYMLGRGDTELFDWMSGRLDEGTNKVTMTLYARKEIDENGLVEQAGYIQLGEPFEIEF